MATVGRHTSHCTVNLSIIRRNLERVKLRAPRAKVLPMVKGNAYGNGMAEVASFLAFECGCNTLGVASLGEAIDLDRQLPTFFSSPKRRLVVFSDPELENAELRTWYRKRNIVPVVHNTTDAQLFIEDPSMSDVPLFVKVNTGMNRNGIDVRDVETVAGMLKKSSRRSRRVDHLLTHFGSADLKLAPGDRTSRQLEAFAKAKEEFKVAEIEVADTSVSNSAAILQGIGVDESWVRPGLMLYGPAAAEPSVPWEGEQCSRFVTKVIAEPVVRRKGELIGYGANPMPEDGLVVNIGVGYADGFLRLYRGFPVTINGLSGKLHGVTSMDASALLFPASAAGKIKKGDSVQLWGHDHNQIDELATAMDTNAYQLMCALSIRVPRRYVRDD